MSVCLSVSLLPLPFSLKSINIPSEEEKERKGDREGGREGRDRERNEGREGGREEEKD